MFSLVSLLAAAALISLQSVHTYAQIEGKLEMDNNLLPNDIPPPRRRVVQKYVKITSHPPETVRHMPGSTLVLECEVMGNPAPMSGWMKNGIPISDFEEDVNEIFSPPTFSVARMTSKLVVRSPSNGDVYTCVATAGLRETSASTTVIVEGEQSDLLSPLIPTKPVITAFYNDIFQLMGTTATLPCRVYSPTKAQVYWIDNNSKLIYGNSRLRVLPSGDLHIKGLSWADMGSYTCSAKNAYGKDVAETFLYPVKP
ncbi:neural/ectodermal development factor IMP-L2-like [Vanessa tameamea]|uniref:Neural/ectodermal development factor IMP-L2-like n=1 Tax=Vanessa tameamea TaxID=334116 RepID=A0A8B8HGP5_VANTA|nr:neural/ectodermal development factor IMP-L2-like [Vanessa tameamea]